MARTGLSEKLKNDIIFTTLRENEQTDRNGRFLMVAKTSILKELETIYGKSGNQLYVLYGRTDSEKEQLLKAFLSDKKYFYYRCRQASGQEQRKQMETEIRQKFSANITKHRYDEFFNRIKSGDASKLVVVIDEFQLIAKKMPLLWRALKN